MSRTSSHRVLPTNEFLALINANNPSATNPFVTLNDLLSNVSPVTVLNFSALPAANTVPGEFYWCRESQGTRWLLTFKPAGLYYSDGASWTTAPIPYQASQAEVGTEVGDGSTVTDKFVSPQTLYGKGYSRIDKVASGTVPAHRVVILSGNQVILFDPTDPTHYGKVLGISYNSGNLGDVITVITDDEVTFGIPLLDGVIYYGGANGTLVSTAPTTGIVQPVGMSNASGRFIVHIGTPILKA